MRLIYFGRRGHAMGEQITLSFQDYDLWINISGKALLETKGKEYSLGPMDAVLMTPGTSISCRILEEIDHIYYHFIVVGENGNPINCDFTDCLIPSKQLDLLNILTNHYELLKEEHIYGKIVTKSILKILFSHMVLMNSENQNLFASGETYSDLNLLSGVIKYINDHISEPISIKTLAALLHFNDTYFCRYFKERLGVSPKQYITKLKMEYACHLMLEQGLSVKETALMTGFADSFSFSKQFKKYYRIPPTVYKELNT